MLGVRRHFLTIMHWRRDTFCLNTKNIQNRILERAIYLIRKDSSMNGIFAAELAPACAAKVRGAAVPPEYNLVRLTQRIENPKESWHTNTPGCEWDFVSCNEQGDVINITWIFIGLQGSLCWEYLPKQLMILSLTGNHLKGEIPLSDMPYDLEFINMGENEFGGSIELQHLPPTLEYLYLHDNLFDCQIKFTLLPKSLLELVLHKNGKLRGELDVSLLPESLKYNMRNTGITALNGPTRRGFSL